MRPGSPSSDLLERFERHLVDWFHEVPVRASVSFVGVEPIDVLRFRNVKQAAHHTLTLVTRGMSRRPMTPPDSLAVSADGPRAELTLDGRAADDAWRSLAVLAAAPAVEGVAYAAGSTVDLGVPLTYGSRCTGGVIDLSEIPSLHIKTVRIDTLRVLPATSSELAWSRVHGVAALRKRWTQQSVDLLDLMRPGARLR